MNVSLCELQNLPVVMSESFTDDSFILTLKRKSESSVVLLAVPGERTLSKNPSQLFTSGDFVFTGRKQLSSHGSQAASKD